MQLSTPRYAVINDQHFGVNGDNPFFLENYKLFYREVFHPALAAAKVDAVLIPGDLWQSRKTINPLTLRFTFDEFFDPLAKAGIPVYIAYGNHDVYYKNTNAVNTIDFLGKMYPHVTVVPDWQELPGGVVLMSWIAPDNQEMLFKVIEDAPAQYLVGHFEIEGHEMTPGYPCEHGLKASMFAKWKKVISGHFHVRSTDGKITYTSNPSQTNWADWGQEKGFHILDTADGSLTAINNPFEVYAVHAYSADELETFADPAATSEWIKAAFADKIVKVVVESFQAVKLDVFKTFVAAVQEVAHRVVIDESVKYDGASEFEVKGDVKTVSLKEVVVDYTKEMAPPDRAEECVTAMTDLYERATQ